jgi:hypothetical protein
MGFEELLEVVGGLPGGLDAFFLFDLSRYQHVGSLT